MSIFKPTLMMKKITDILPETFHEIGVKNVLLDVDNTLASYRSHEPIDGAIEWTKEMEKAGFNLVIVSNNYRSRVRPFAEKFGLPFITFACKPFPHGYLKAKKLLKVKSTKDCVIVGDQIFTDVIGANLCGMKSILLEPVEIETGISFDIRRGAEKNLRKKYK
jgi:HAD superfamily (subfamily IIIA) phosphatase, TIGR01668